MVNNQLKKYKKEWYLVRRKNTFEKKRSLLGFAGSAGSLVDQTGWPNFTGLLLKPIFYLTRTDLAIESTGSRINPLDRSRFNKHEWYNQDNRVYYKLKYSKIKNSVTMKKNLKYLIFSIQVSLFKLLGWSIITMNWKLKIKKNIFYIFKLTRLNNTENVSEVIFSNDIKIRWGNWWPRIIEFVFIYKLKK
jgi:hypothetical protein